MRTEAQKRAALQLDANRVRVAREVFAEVKNGRDLDGGCDDWEFPEYLTAAERRSLIEDYHMWNGDPEEAEDYTSLQFSCVHSYLTAAVLHHAERWFK